MLKAYLIRGLKTGAIGGLAYGIFIATIGTGFVDVAESFEASTGHEDPAVSGIVTTAGSIGGGLLWGLLLGVLIFGLAYYFFEPTLPGRPDTQSYLLGAGGFLTVSGTPWLVLPPQPPGVEQALPTETRVIWYAALMLTGAVASGAAIAAYSRLADRYGPLIGIAGGLLPILSLGAIVLVGPANPTTGPAPDALVAAFRWTVVAGQLGLWIVLAGSHAWFLRRERGSPSEPAEHSQEAEWHSINH